MSYNKKNINDLIKLCRKLSSTRKDAKNDEYYNLNEGFYNTTIFKYLDDIDNLLMRIKL